MGRVDEEEHGGGRQQLGTVIARAIAGVAWGADGSESRDGLKVGFVCELVRYSEVAVDEEEWRVLRLSGREPF